MALDFFFFGACALFGDGSVVECVASLTEVRLVVVGLWG